MKPLKLPNKTWCTRWRWGPGPEKTEFSFSPVEETNVRRYVFTYFLTSSSLVRLKSLRILVALLGPLILGFSVSVSPGRWLSPGSHQVITVIQNFSQSTSNQAMTCWIGGQSQRTNSTTKLANRKPETPQRVAGNRAMEHTLLHNDKIKHREVRADNAASHRLTATLTIAPSITPEARGT